MTKNKVMLSFLFTLLFPLTLFACASNNDNSNIDQSATESISLTGTVEVDGSSTVSPVSEAVAEEFKKLHPKANVLVGISGTGGGFKRFTIGEIDISDASRSIK